MTAIRVELELADGNFTTRMLNAGQSIRQFQESVTRSSPALQNLAAAGFNVVKSVDLADTRTKSFITSLRDLSIAVGIVSVGINKLTNIQSTWIGSLVKTNMEFERLTYQMRSMSTAADPIKEAGQQVSYLRKSAMEMPFALSTINNAFVKLKATGTDPLNGSLKAIADGVAAFGGTDEAFERVVLGISQMSGKGVIQMEELRQQLGEQMPTAVAIMARSVGVSMGQLIKDISTGTVSSKETLASFYRELDRAYGGRAQYMMQTFAGQVKKAQTQLQTLALTAGGVDLTTGIYQSGKLMDTLRQQLRDINSLMGSKMGSAIAEDIGNAMTTAVRWIRSGIETVIEFRNEIVSTGKAIAIAFGANMAISGIARFGASLSETTVKLRALSMAFGASKSHFSLMTQAIGAGAPAMSIMTQGFMAARTAFLPLMSGLAVAAPWVAALGVAVYGAAQYFGVFSHKVDEAYESLVKYGAESRKQALEMGQPKVDELNAQIKDLQAQRDVQQRNIDHALNDYNRQQAESNLKLIDAKLAAKRAELAEVTINVNKAEAEAGNEQDRRAIDKYLDDLEEKIQGQKVAYNNLSNDTQEHYNKLAEQELKAGKSSVAIEEERGKKLRELQVAQYDFEIGIYKDAATFQKEMMERARDPAAVSQAEKLYATLSERLKTLYELRNATLNQSVGTDKISKPIDDNKAFSKGQQYLDNLKAKVEGLKAELTGASGAVVELQAILARPGKYGDDDIKRVRELKDEIIATKAQKEALDNLLEGKKKLENDIENATVKALEEQAEIKAKMAGKDLSDSERIAIRIQEGYYKGFGPKSQVMMWLDGILKSFNAQGEAANQLGPVIRDNVFGSKTNNNIMTVADSLGKVLNTLTGIGNGLNGLNWNNFQFSGDKFLPGGDLSMSPATKAKMGDVMGMFLTEGLSAGIDRKIAAAITGNFAKESGLNPSAVGDGGTSVGFGQWHNERGVAMKDFAGGMGMNPSDPLAQVRFTIHELTTSYAGVLAAMKNAATPEEAAQIFMKGYERPAAWAAAQSGPGRQAAARTAYNSGPTAAVPGVGNGTISTDLPVFNAGGAAEAYAAWQKEIEGVLKKQKELQDIEAQNTHDKKTLKLIEAERELNASIDAQKENMDGVNSEYEKRVKLIKEGKLLDSKDPNDPAYATFLARAKELDAVTQKANDRRKDKSKIDRFEDDQLQREIDLNHRLAEAKNRIKDPDQLKSSKEWRRLQSDFEEYVRRVEEFYGRDSDQYRAAVEKKKQALQDLKNTETTEAAATWAQRTREINRSFMTESQKRQDALQQEIARIDAEVAAYQGSESQKLVIVAAAEKQKAALRRQAYEAGNPMAAQMREWSDLQGNLMKASTQWMDSLADGITGLITGTGNLKNAINDIIKSFVNTGVKYVMSQIMGAKGQARGAAGGGKLGGGLGKAGGGSKKGLGAFPAAPALGLFHTGGIIGARAPMHRVVDPRAFIGAKRFHTGGVIGAPRLASDEVPIIGKKGEGVFTAEQMAQMGGFSSQVFQISAPVTVNGSAGTPEQNNDLAKRMAKQMEATMRGVVASEIQKQTRPGNVLNQRSGGR